MGKSRRKGPESEVDFARNREGVYGGLPEARAHVKPEKNSRKADFERNREGLYGGLPDVREPQEKS